MDQPSSSSFDPRALQTAAAVALDGLTGWEGFQPTRGTNTSISGIGGWPGAAASASLANRPHAGIFSQTSQPNQTLERMINDYPPVWDGKDPLAMLEPYLKELQGWMVTTRVPKTQQGLSILRKATGDLLILVNELDIEMLTSENSGSIVSQKTKTAYWEFLETEEYYAGRYEALLYEKNGKRQSGERVITYISRKKTLMRNLERVDKELQSNFKGCCLLRDARLDQKQAEMIHNWTKGRMSFDKVEENLKSIERPNPSAYIGEQIKSLTWAMFEDQDEGSREFAYFPGGSRVSVSDSETAGETGELAQRGDLYIKSIL